MFEVPTWFVLDYRQYITQTTVYPSLTVCNDNFKIFKFINQFMHELGVKIC